MLELKDVYFSVLFNHLSKQIVRSLWADELHEFVCFCFVPGQTSTKDFISVNGNSSSSITPNKYSNNCVSRRHIVYWQGNREAKMAKNTVIILLQQLNLF